VRVLRFNAQAVFYLVLMPAALLFLFAICAFLLSLGAGPVVPLNAVVLMGGFAVLLTRVRHRRAATVLAYLDQAVQLNLPIQWMLARAAEAESGFTRDTLKGLSRALTRGRTVGQALAQHAPEIGADRLKLIQAAEHLGQLGPTLHQLNRINTPSSVKRKAELGIKLLYPACIFFAITGAVFFMLIYVFPQYEEIFSDFDMPLPGPTHFVVRLIHQPAVIYPCYVLGHLAFAAFWIYLTWAVLKPRWLTLGPLRGLADAVVWRLPFFGAAARDRGLAAALPLLADATEAGTPLENALCETQNLRINHQLRKRFNRFQQSLGNGATLRQAADDAKLPGMVTQLLGPATRSNCLPETLRFLASHYQLRFSKTLTLIENALGPAVLIFFGFVVGTIILGAFLPLISVIHSLSDPWGLM
jgi:type II secretory pathway component PulF